MSKYASVIRTILCVVVMIVMILGWVDIIPSTIGIIVASVILCGVSSWNGVESFKNGRKGNGIFNVIVAVLLIAICVAAILL